MSDDTLEARLLARCRPSTGIKAEAPAGVEAEPLCETDLPYVSDFFALYEHDALELIFICMYDAKVWIDGGKEPSGLEEFLETFDLNATGLYLDLDGYRLFGGDRSHTKHLMEIFDVDQSEAALIRDWLVWLNGKNLHLFHEELLPRCLRYWNLRVEGGA